MNRSTTALFSQKLKNFFKTIDGLSDRQLFIFLPLIILLAQIAYALFIFNAQEIFQTYAVGHATLAHNLLNKGIYSVDGINPTAYRPPLYALLLHSMMRLFGDRWIVAAVATHVILTTICGFLILFLTNKIFKDKFASLFAVVLYLTDLYFQREALAQRETILFTTIVLAFYSILFRRKSNLKTYLLLSMFAVLAHLTRATGIVLVVLLFTFLYLEWQRRKSPTSIIHASIAIVLFVSLVFPWHFYMYKNFNLISYSSATVGGWNLFKGSNPEILKYYPAIDLDKYDNWIDKTLKEKGIEKGLWDEVKADRYLKKESFRYIKENPLGFLKVALVKIFAYYSPVPTPLGDGKLVEQDGHLILSEFNFLRKPQALMLYFLHALLILLGSVGFYIKWIQKQIQGNSKVAYIAGLFILLTTVHILTFAETRYRLPLNPFMIITSAIFYTTLLRGKISVIPKRY